MNIQVICKHDGPPLDVGSKRSGQTAFRSDNHKPEVGVRNIELTALSVEPQPKGPAAAHFVLVLPPRRRVHSISTRLLGP